MNKVDTKTFFLKQLENVLNAYEHAINQTERKKIGHIGSTAAYRLITLARAAIERIGGVNSAYQKQAEAILRSQEADFLWARDLKGVVESLKMDLEAGYIESISELMHGELFGDFLDMASHLLNEGYKDASAVIAGSSLEAHLRQICNKFSVDTESGAKPKKADLINSELVKASAYSKLVQKNITAWLDLRNNAAHGKYDEYVKEEVSLMIAGIRDFITRYPA